MRRPRKYRVRAYRNGRLSVPNCRHVAHKWWVAAWWCCMGNETATNDSYPTKDGLDWKVESTR